MSGSATAIKDFYLRVGQFNVMNLVREGVTYYGREKYAKEEVEKKTKWIAHQLDLMEADICAFEEVFHDDVLMRAIHQADYFKGKKGELVCLNCTGNSPVVALYSTYPVVSKQSIENFPKESSLHFDGYGDIPMTKFSRPVVRVQVKLPNNMILTIFVAHAKSKRPIVSDSLRHDPLAKATGHALSLVQRAAESVALRHILVHEMQNNNNPVVVCGDLNDNIHAVSSEILTGTPPWKKLDQKTKRQIWDTMLWDTTEIQVRTSDRDVTYSHIHNGRYENLDHILVSEEFVRQNPNHIGYVQFVQLFNDHLVDETLSDMPRKCWQSDHGQVVAMLKIYGSGAPKSARVPLVSSSSSLSIPAPTGGSPSTPHSPRSSSGRVGSSHKVYVEVTKDSVV